MYQLQPWPAVLASTKPFIYVFNVNTILLPSSLHPICGCIGSHILLYHYWYHRIHWKVLYSWLVQFCNGKGLKLPWINSLKFPLHGKEYMDSYCWIMVTSSNGKHFPRYWPFVWRVHRSPASNADLWCFLWSAPWINGWLNNREAGDLRRHRAHYDVIVMSIESDVISNDIRIISNYSIRTPGSYRQIPMTRYVNSFAITVHLNIFFFCKRVLFANNVFPL